jgi:DNA-binding response OmpR family regulator
MCLKCDALEDENRYLKRLLALDNDQVLADRLSAKLKLRPQEGRLLAMLYQRQGRVAAKGLLFDALHDTPGHMGDEKIVDVLMTSLRKKLGPDCIGTIWGRGVILTVDGLELVSRALGQEKAA